MGGSKGEEQKGNVAWAEVGPVKPRPTPPACDSQVGVKPGTAVVCGMRHTELHALPFRLQCM